jgi:tetratricopeptide (TPR) repeat protein
MNFCSKCGQKLEKEQKYCHNCGNKFEETEITERVILEHKIENKSHKVDAKDKKKTRKSLILKIIAIIVLLSCLVCGGIFLVKHNRTVEAIQQFKLGNKYLEDGKYEEAVLAFQKIIKIEPKNIEARLQLAKAYEKMNKFENAEKILKEAMTIDNKRPEPYIELGRLYLYSDRIEDAKAIWQRGFEITNDIRLKRLLDEITQRKLVGQVVEALSDSPLEEAEVNAYTGNNYEELVATTKSVSDGTFALKLKPGKYKIEVSNPGFIPVVSYQTVNEENIAYQAKLYSIKREDGSNGIVLGKIIDAFSGRGVSISNQAISFLPGVYNEIPENINTEYKTNTTSDGEYSISLPVGNYTAVINHVNGYSSTFFNVLAISNTNMDNQNGTITPIIPEDQIRIVLTWGNTPNDLDSHLTGPGNQNDRFHTFYEIKSYHGQADLDLDNTIGYGPETTTIYGVMDGVYRYSVHNYSEKESSASSTLSNSNAKVTVYFGSRDRKIFNVPNNKEGTLWTVFEIRNKEIIPINRLSYQNNNINIE